jgi:hypothetical protein
MKKRYQKNEVLARGKEVYIGINVHRDSWHVTARTKGEEILHGRMPSQYPLHYHSLRGHGKK